MDGGCILRRAGRGTVMVSADCVDFGFHKLAYLTTGIRYNHILKQFESN